MYIDGRNRNISILGEGPKQGLDNAIITAKAKCPTDFTESGKRFVLSLHCNGRIRLLFVNAVKLYQFKAKNSEINLYPLRLGNILKDFNSVI